MGQGIQGTSGADVICGLGGNDLIFGNGGNDLIDGGTGSDRVGYQNAPSAVSVNLGSGAVSGGAGNDQLRNIEGVMDSPHSDTLTGSSGNDYFWLTSGGADTISGGAGSDTADYTYAPGECADDSLTGIEDYFGCP